jgi:hypothetical protein
MADLFDGRLEDAGVHEHHSKDEDAPDNARCLTDGESFLWVYGDESGLVKSFTRYASNGANGLVGYILAAISDAFDVDIFSEHQPQFWGFETVEEWDAAWAAISRAHNNEKRAAAVSDFPWVDLSPFFDALAEVAAARDQQKRNFASSRYWNDNSHLHGLLGEQVISCLTGEPLNIELLLLGDNHRDIRDLDVKAATNWADPAQRRHVRRRCAVLKSRPK